MVARPQELYAEFVSTRADVRVGYSRIVWGRLDELHPAELREMVELLPRLETALEEAYSPDGMNIGLNLGSAAGAGVGDHLHWHLLPRWSGDTNFLGATSDTRVLSESLENTLKRLRRVLESSG